MKKYKLLLAYDGTDFGGWQIQPNTPSIQEHLQKALGTILREDVHVAGSGRTDAGVHAHGQVAHFQTTQSFIPSRLHYSLNGLLPKTIRVLEIEEVSLDFHARFSAKKKIYHYNLSTGPTKSPFNRLYRTHISHKLHSEAMELGAKYFIGTHDFTSFANQGGTQTDPIKTIYSLNVISAPDQIRLEFVGSGFLYKMVRNIVGTLLDVAYLKLRPEDIPTILEKKDRKHASGAAPPEGLFLMQVIY